MLHRSTSKEQHKKLGNRTGTLKTNSQQTRVVDGETYWSVKTGVTDHLGDEVILTVFPNLKIVTDEGYTEFVLNSERVPVELSKAKLLISTHDVQINNSFKQELQVSYQGNEWELATRKLLSCIIDVYSIVL